MGRTACTEPQCLYKGVIFLLLTIQLGIRTDTWEGKYEIPVRIHLSQGK